MFEKLYHELTELAYRCESITEVAALMFRTRTAANSSVFHEITVRFEAKNTVGNMNNYYLKIEGNKAGNAFYTLFNCSTGRNILVKPKYVKLWLEPIFDKYNVKFVGGDK